MFKKTIKPTPKPDAVPAPATPASVAVERRLQPRPLPVPEVIEGSGGESEWAMWLEHTERLARSEPQPAAPDSSKPAASGSDSSNKPGSAKPLS